MIRYNTMTNNLIEMEIYITERKTMEATLLCVHVGRQCRKMKGRRKLSMFATFDLTNPCTTTHFPQFLGENIRESCLSYEFVFCHIRDGFSHVMESMKKKNNSK